jgi:hypothetical protein
MPIKKPTLVQQLLGACIGGVLAVALYYTYTLGVPAIQGYILQPEQYPKFFSGETTTISNTQLKGEPKNRIATRVEKAINLRADALHNGAPTVQSRALPDSQFAVPSTNSTVRPYQVFTQNEPEQILYEEVTTTTTETITETIQHAEQLPQSGTQDYLLFAAALVGALGLHTRRKSTKPVAKTM